MPRFMKAKVSKTELVNAIIKAAKRIDHDEYDEDDIECAIYTLVSNEPADLQKVSFDCENVLCKKFDIIHDSAVCWAYAGGDWEYPVNFVIYLDDKNKLRFYIPSNGNAFCHKCMHAYGSCECNMKTDYDDDTAEDIFDMFSDDEDDDVEEHEKEEDFSAMKKDAEARLQLKV